MIVAWLGKDQTPANGLRDQIAKFFGGLNPQADGLLRIAQ
jgi:hypothetical protein